jgi:hypothetical protein
VYRSLYQNSLTGTLPTELGTMDALSTLCVCPLTHHAWTRALSPGCGLSAAATWVYRALRSNYLTGTLPTELGTMTGAHASGWVCVRRPHPPRLDVCAVTGLWAERGGYVEECRELNNNGFAGTLPTELGTMDALLGLWVPSPHPPRLHACAVIGLWAERGVGDVGCAGS